MDFCNDSLSYFAHCLCCGEHYEKRYGSNADGCGLCGSDRKPMHELDCAAENGCTECLQVVAPEDRRAMFRLVIGGKAL